MKKIRFFSVVMVVAMAMLMSNAWAGQQIYNFNPTMQGIFDNNSYTYTAVAQKVVLTGPATSVLDSVVVEGTFGSSCIISKRTMQILNNNQTSTIASNTFSDSKFKVKIPIPSGNPANGTYYIRFVAERVQLTNPCAPSINSGTGKATFYWRP